MLIRCLLVLSLFSVTARAQSAALVRLKQSPRPQEWVDLKCGDRLVHPFVVYP